jgi:hypothetical protein
VAFDDGVAAPGIVVDTGRHRSKPCEQTIVMVDDMADMAADGGIKAVAGLSDIVLVTAPVQQLHPLMQTTLIVFD